MEWDSVLSTDAKGHILAQLERVEAIAWSVQHGCPTPPPDPINLFEAVDLGATVRLIVSLWLPDTRPITAAEEHTLVNQSIMWVPRDYFTDDAVVAHWTWAAEATRGSAIRALWDERMAAVAHWCRLVTPYLVIDIRNFVPGEDLLLDLVHQLQALRAGLGGLGYGPSRPAER